MSEVKKCPKCSGIMVRGLGENLGLAFGCTRTEPKKPEDLPADRVQPYYCGNCGYMEFYKKLNSEGKSTE